MQSTGQESRKMIKVSRTALKAARELLEITQEDLGQAASVTNVTISCIESGAREPKAATIRKIVRALTAMGIEFSNGTGVGVRLDYKKAAAYKAAQATTQQPVDPDLG
jgi:transcriptional regulator with XRE-family HTH domain